MTDERLTPERAARLLRAKAAELENKVKAAVGLTGEEWIFLDLAADIALVAQLLADHIERTEPWSHDIDDVNVRDQRKDR